ncbi:50S ribosomal protein L29 [Candidatus Omnitrophota bacterium]
MLEANELRNMTVEEIQNKIEGLKQSLFTLRTEAKGGRIEKPHKIRECKRDIARCETIIREKSNAAGIQKA